MKYWFNKIFPLLIKLEENAGKPYYGLNLGLLGPNLGYRTLLDILALLIGRHCSKLSFYAI